MQKATRRRLMLLSLPAFIIFAVSLIGFFSGLYSSSTAYADDTQVAQKNVSGKQNCTDVHRGPSFGSDVVVYGDEVVCSNITSFGGKIIIQGQLYGDIVAFGTSVIIDGAVHGTISLYSGDITLQNNAAVYGDIHLCQGKWEPNSDQYLHGTLDGCPKSIDQLLVADMGPSFHFWSIIAWDILGVLLIVLLPEHLTLIQTTVKNKKRRSLILGVLSVLLALPILAILVALIVSIPLAIIVIIGLIAAWALGTVAVGALLGEHIVRVIIPQKNTRLVQVVVGLTVLVLAGSLPYIGWLISLCAGLIGLGAVFLSRFGTRLYSQPKQPILL